AAALCLGTAEARREAARDAPSRGAPTGFGVPRRRKPVLVDYPAHPAAGLVRRRGAARRLRRVSLAGSARRAQRAGADRRREADRRSPPARAPDRSGGV